MTAHPEPTRYYGGGAPFGPRSPAVIRGLEIVRECLDAGHKRYGLFAAVAERVGISSAHLRNAWSRYVTNPRERKAREPKQKVIHHELARQYRAGASIHQLARATGVSEATVRNRLMDAGVKLRPSGGVQLKVSPTTHRVIKDLAKVIGHGEREAKKAGLSRNFWWNARRGSASPTIDNLEALANAAGYEIVLRRRGS